MPWAISRDEQIAARYRRLTELSAAMVGMTDGSPPKIGLQAKANAVYAEIVELEKSRSISPKAVLVGVGIIALLLWNLLH
ncbi:hypothetical protein ACWCYY_34965 [Kitasatospora sp. NPDC001664]